MSVKSRAQLIVWCMPHLSFSEEDRRDVAGPSAATGTQQATINESIPVGNSPVGGSRIGGTGTGTGTGNFGI